MHPKRLAIVITGLDRGGAEVMLWKLLAHISFSRFSPIVISLGNAGPIAEKLRALNVEVHAIGLKAGLPSVTGLLRLIRLILRIKPDLIQGWMLHGNLAAVIGGIVTGAPVIWGIRHSYMPDGTEKSMTLKLERWMKYLSRYPAKIIYNSMSGREHHERLGYLLDRGVVIPNGFEVVTVPGINEARDRVRKEIEAENYFLVGLIGRYHPIKGHRIFLDAASRFLKLRGRAKFLLVGPGCDTSNPELMSLVRQSGLEHAVIMLGSRGDIGDVISAIDILTSSSISEGFSNVIGEAMAAGTPCVVTNVGDSQWIVGDCGMVVPPEDPEALAEAWHTLAAMNKTEREALGQKARQRIADHFSIQAVARAYEEVYGGVIEA